MVTTPETNEGRQLDESLVKQLKGGDMMKARFLSKEFFSFMPRLKVWITTNHHADDPRHG